MLKYISSAELALWRSYLNRLPPEFLDIHFLPEMMLPYEAADLGNGLLLAIDQGEEFLIQPILTMNDGVKRHPYNFGGPISTPGFVPADCVNDAEFILNPFLADRQLRLISGEVKHMKDTIWIDLTKPNAFRQTTRHMVDKAEGVEVNPVDKTYENIDIFCSMYSEHMSNIKAAEHWKLSTTWFRALFGALGNSMSTLMFAKIEDEVVGACILVHAYGTCYYHFAVSGREPKGIAHRMVNWAVELARSEGYKRFHLGGGVSGNDGLFLFKSGFSDLTLPVYKHESKND